MEIKSTQSPQIPRKTSSSLSFTRQSSGGITPVKTRLKRISSISNPKHIRSSRIKRQEPNPPKFLFLNDIVESALNEGLQVGGDKLLLDADNDELSVSLSILQYHLDQVEKLRNEYTHQLKIHDGASNLDQAYGEQPVTRAKRKSKAAIKTNLKKLNEKLLDLEDQMFDLMGYLQITFKGLLDIPRLINNDCYEACFELSEQKWKTKGTIKNKEQKWQDEHLMMTILGDNTLMDVQALQIRRFLGNVLLGSAKFNAYDLISLHPQNVLLVLKGTTHVKLNLEVRWKFGYDDPDYGRIMDFSMHDVIIGSARQDYIKKRAKHMSIQRARRVNAELGGNTEVNIDICHSKSFIKDNELVDKDQTLVPESKHSMPEMSTRGDDDGDDLTQSTMSELPQLNETFSRPSPVRNVCSVLHRSPSQFKRGQVGYKPILIESDSARKELMSNLDLDLCSNNSETNGSVCNLLEAYDNLWVCIEEKKDFCEYVVLTDLEARLSKLYDLTRNKGGKHERSTSLTTSESEALDAFDFLNESTIIFEIKPELKRSLDSGINLAGRRDSLTGSLTSGTTSTNSTEDYKACTHTLLPDEYSSDEEELNFILQEMVDISTVALEKDLDVDAFTQERPASINRSETVHSRSSKRDSLPTDDVVVLTTGTHGLDFLLTTHLIYCEGLLQNIKSPSPLQFKINKSLNLLQGQVKVLDTIIDCIDTEEVNYNNLIPNLHKSRELLMLWTACCGDRVSKRYNYCHKFQI
ncbi:Protein FAM65B isoform X2 [Oopsacas minuta]|uniref:Protein FAM65B isoform X2 n=1 Tax=Oopsacas minuta TaxID=111878 RepID=A0AAV7JEW1_9METZ|nr:Protein FAM65B isoform X2 [Oopsacas minuta]